MLWIPEIQTSDGSFGVRTNQFGFNITWASGRAVVVEACTNLAQPFWSPLQTNALTGDTFVTTKKYLGYFDPNKCYTYNGAYFEPAGFAGSNYTCANQWSGNFMNWATMQGVDTFRWVLTGGLRLTDEPKTFASASGSPLGKTVLQRAYASAQGSYLTSNFPDRFLDKSLVKSYTGLPVDFHDRPLWIRNGGMGVQVRFGYEADEKAPNFRSGP